MYVPKESGYISHVQSQSHGPECFGHAIVHECPMRLGLHKAARFRYDEKKAGLCIAHDFVLDQDASCPFPGQRLYSGVLSIR